MEIKRGAIVLAVHADLGKPRPAVVVQIDELNATSSHILVCPLTSDITDKIARRPVIQPSPGTGLREPSQIMVDRMLALRSDRIRVVLGYLDAATTDQLDRALLVVLGLAR
ncbi:MAG: type II toxin-antitoxin system PemK/MazF family toxin [Pseudolabrys sp.]|nr:type II toxin-antitoxin system PemK/MazF family toxin [Pseudolabrys sp.]